MSEVHLNPLNVERHTLQTSLGREQCRRRLQTNLFTWDVLDEWSPTNPRIANPVVGKVSVDGFAIRKWARYRKPFEITASGEFVPAPGGTRVEVYLSIRRLVAAVFVFYFTFLLLLQLGIVTGLVPTPGMSAAEAGFWTPGILLLAGGVAYLLGRWRASQDARFLLRFLADTLEAERTPGEAPSESRPRP